MDNHFSNNIKLLRKARKATQTDLANLLDKKKSAISSYEHGKSMPDINDLVKIADFFEIDLNTLIAKKLDEKILNEIIEYENNDIFETANVTDRVTNLSGTKKSQKVGKEQPASSSSMLFNNLSDDEEENSKIRKVMHLEIEYWKGRPNKLEILKAFFYPDYRDFNRVLEHIYDTYRIEMAAIFMGVVNGKRTENEAFTAVDQILGEAKSMDELLKTISKDINTLLKNIIVPLYPHAYQVVIQGSTLDSQQIEKEYDCATMDEKKFYEKWSVSKEECRSKNTPSE
ncbi:helix-turn-helix domain-containing protein [Tunicatimonas pelagia]|uniref:helix-turn-helix domain-containing protein n=1 Tax=Tunicatimonas pelagia TaxID=931531 RepID=UPI0026667C5C|nr:helix-turn-helix domain-containing protein [Tunicatimonas pelagia]WKN42198.1 helix-turn-helix domain-containing protein [Tunicatimonas pelagia]WKN45316.1 helix-turn-helix domain-containing protein [Tunicatimonas pelagia]